MPLGATLVYVCNCLLSLMVVINHNNSNYFLYTPDSLNLTDLALDFLSIWCPSHFPKAVGSLEVHRFRFACFFTLLFFARKRAKRSKYVNMISIDSTSLKAFVSKDYLQYIQFLEEKKIIERPTSYLPGEFSKSFSLRPPHLQSKFHPDTTFNSELVKRAIEQLLAARRRKSKPATQGNGWIMEELEQCALQIQLDDKTEEAKQLYIQRKKNQGKIADLEDFQLNVEVMRAHDQHPAWYFIRPKNNGRVYSSITSCQRELRKCFIYQGKPLVELDQRASQPFLLLTFYRDCKQIDAGKEAAKYYDFWCPTRNGGDFYSNLIPNEPRELVKRALIEGFLNSRVNSHHSDPDVQRVNAIAQTCFQKEFPILWSGIHNLKTHRRREIPLESEKEIYKQFAYCMQDVESKIFINRIAAECLMQKIFVYTVHDCIGCLQADIPRVQKIAEDVLLGETGFKPFFKV